VLLITGGEEELPEESEVVEEAFQGEMKRHNRGGRERERERTRQKDTHG